MNPNKVTGKWFVILLCQRARVLEQTINANTIKALKALKFKKSKLVRS